MFLTLSNTLNQIAAADPDIRHYQAGWPTDVFSVKVNDDTPRGEAKEYPALLFSLASDASIVDSAKGQVMASLIFYMPATVTNAGTAQTLSFAEARHLLETIARRTVRAFTLSGLEGRRWHAVFPFTMRYDLLRGRAAFHVVEVVVPTLILLDCIDEEVEVVTVHDGQEDLEKILDQ